MKNSLMMHPVAGTNTTTTAQNGFPSINLFTEIPAYAGKNLPVIVSAYLGPVFPEMKTSATGKGLKPLCNILLKQVGARLSDIELALDCNDAFHLKVPTQILNGLFLTMNMPEATRLTGQMEVMAKENKLQELNNLLRALKKIIAQSVQQNQQALT